jgi:hypothetical protein
MSRLRPAISHARRAHDSGARSHTASFPLPYAAASVFPSGLKARAISKVHGFVCRIEGRTDRREGGGVLQDPLRRLSTVALRLVHRRVSSLDEGFGSRAGPAEHYADAGVNDNVCVGEWEWRGDG